MLSKKVILLLLVPLLALSACRQHTARSYDPSAVNFSVQYNEAFDGCLYPSLILGVAGLTDPMPQEAALFVVSVTSPASGSILRITVDSSRLNYVTIIQEELPERGKTYTFYPRLKWKYEALYATRQSGLMDLTFTCFINDEQVDVRNVRLNYRSANECLISLRDLSNNHHDFRWLFAGYVNEDHPYIDSILTDILDQRIVSRFVGYQQGEKAVTEQVFAFWYYALQRGISYSSITCTSNPSKRTNVQRIRFFDEVYNSRQANCVVACVFVASLMRKVGLKPVIFVEPCHAYLGYYTDRNRRKIALLETTVTSWVNFPELDRNLDNNGHLSAKYYNKVKRFLSEKDQKRYAEGKMDYDELKHCVARTLFAKATEYNQSNYATNKTLFADTSSVAYQQLDIELLRRMVQPIN